MHSQNSNKANDSQMVNMFGFSPFSIIIQIERTKCLDFGSVLTDEPKVQGTAHEGCGDSCKGCLLTSDVRGRCPVFLKGGCREKVLIMHTSWIAVLMYR